jgi:hypothetical protein
MLTRIAFSGQADVIASGHVYLNKSESLHWELKAMFKEFGAQRYEWWHVSLKH